MITRDEALAKAIDLASTARSFALKTPEDEEHEAQLLANAAALAQVSQAFSGIALTIDAIEAGVPVFAVPPPFAPDPRLMGHMEKGQHRPEDDAR